MQRKVFISYRRDDSAGEAGRIYDRLRAVFGSSHIFMDVDSISLGVDFSRALGDAVAKCDVLLALIGRNWLDIRDQVGKRRLDSATDFVRIEVATALKRQIPVIPILLQGAQVPSSEQLPDELKGLARRNALDVRHPSFDADIDKLIRAILPMSSRLGAQLRAQNGYDATITKSDDIISIRSRMKRALKNIDNAKTQVEQVNAKKAYAEESQKESQISSEVYKLRSSAHAFHEIDPAKAILYYEEAIRLDPDSAETYRDRGLFYFALRDWEKAINDIHKAISLNPIMASEELKNLYKRAQSNARGGDSLLSRLFGRK